MKINLTLTEEEAEMVMRCLNCNAQQWYDLMHKEGVNKEHVIKKFGKALSLIEKVREQINEQYEDI